MARYFMADTRLAGLERMMMTPPRTPSIRADARRKKPQKKPPCNRSTKPRHHKSEIKEGGV